MTDEAKALVERLRHDYGDWICDEAADLIETQAREIERLRADKERLDFLQYESRDLRCFDMPTGSGDADIGWRVIGHFMAKPYERVLAEVYTDNVRAVIDAALAGDSHV